MWIYPHFFIEVEFDELLEVLEFIEQNIKLNKIKGLMNFKVLKSTHCKTPESQNKNQNDVLELVKLHTVGRDLCVVHIARAKMIKCVAFIATGNT